MEVTTTEPKTKKQRMEDPEEQALLFHSLIIFIRGERRLMTNGWFIIHPLSGPGIVDAFGNTLRNPMQREAVIENSVFAGSHLCTVGGREAFSGYAAKSIHHLDTRNRHQGWKSHELPFDCDDDRILGVYGESLFILPSSPPDMYYDSIDDLPECPSSYIWNIRDGKSFEIQTPQCLHGDIMEWNEIRACAAWEGRGLLVAMDGEKHNFFLHNGEPDGTWMACEDDMEPLPKFTGGWTTFAAKDQKLYILKALGGDPPPAHLYIYDFKMGKLVMNGLRIPVSGFGIQTFWKTNIRLVPVTDDKISFMWLDDCRERTHSSTQVLHHMKVQILEKPEPSVKVLINQEFDTPFLQLLNCLPYDLQDEVEGKTPMFLPRDVQVKINDAASQDSVEHIAYSSSEVKERLLLVAPSNLCATCVSRVLKENSSRELRTEEMPCAMEDM